MPHLARALGTNIRRGMRQSRAPVREKKRLVSATASVPRQLRPALTACVLTVRSSAQGRRACAHAHTVVGAVFVVTTHHRVTAGCGPTRKHRHCERCAATHQSPQRRTRTRPHLYCGSYQISYKSPTTWRDQPATSRRGAVRARPIAGTGTAAAASEMSESAQSSHRARASPDVLLPAQSR